MPVQEILFCLVVGYAFGNIPNGYLYAKTQGIDIYKEGSGNPGSTNILRTLGKKAGITVLLMDIAKCMLPIFFMVLFFKPENEDLKSLGIYASCYGIFLLCRIVWEDITAFSFFKCGLSSHVCFKFSTYGYAHFPA